MPFKKFSLNFNLKETHLKVLIRSFNCVETIIFTFSVTSSLKIITKKKSNLSSKVILLEPVHATDSVLVVVCKKNWLKLAWKVNIGGSSKHHQQHQQDQEQAVIISATHTSEILILDSDSSSAVKEKLEKQQENQRNPPKLQVYARNVWESFKACVVSYFPFYV